MADCNSRYSKISAGNICLINCVSEQEKPYCFSNSYSASFYDCLVSFIGSQHFTQPPQRATSRAHPQHGRSAARVPSPAPLTLPAGPRGSRAAGCAPGKPLAARGLLHVLRGLCSQPSPGLRQGLFLLCSCLLNTTWHCCVCTCKALPVLINAVGKTRLCINLLSLSFTPCFSRRARLVLTTFCKLMRADEQLCCALSHMCSCCELQIQPWGWVNVAGGMPVTQACSYVWQCPALKCKSDPL